MRWLTVHVVIWLSLLPAQAQYSVGGGFGMALASHTAHFRSLSPDIPTCCPGFEKATGIEWELAATYDGFPLGTRLRLLLEAGYQRQDATFRQYEPTTVASPSGQGVPGTFEHELRTIRQLLTTRLLLGYTPVVELPQWQLRAGFQVGWTFATAFWQRERLVEPDYGYFADTGTRTRNERSGRIPGALPVSLAFGIGTRYLLPIFPEQHIALQPSLMGWLGLTRFVRDRTWQAHALAFSLGLVYAPLELPSPLQPGTRP